MLPYFVICAIVLCLNLALILLLGQNRKLLFSIDFLMACTLIVFAGFRADSIDYQEYVIMFNAAKDAFLLSESDAVFIGKDIFFGVLIVTLIKLGLESSSLFLAAAILSVGVKFLVFRKVFGCAAVAGSVYFFTYYFLHDFTQIRAAIAIAFCFLSLVLLIQGKRWQYLIFGVIAIGFHSQAALFLIVTSPLLMGYSRGIKLVVPVATMFVLLMPVVMNLVLQYAHRPGIGEGGVDVALNLMLVTLINAVFIFLIYAFSRKGLANDFAERLSLVSLLLVVTGVMFLILTYGTSSTLGARAMEMFMSFGVFVVAFAVHARRSMPAIVLSLFYFLFNILVLMNSSLLVEYRFAKNFL